MTSSNPTVLLFGFPKPPNGPSSSGFCQKLETFLRFTSTSYEVRESRLDQAPKGKLPYVNIHKPNSAPETVADTHFIIRRLIEEGISTDPDLSAGLTPLQKADSRAWQAYFEDLVYISLVYERWFIDENFAILADEIFGAIPWLIKPALTWYMRRNVRNSLWGHGIGRHSVEEVMILQQEAVEALEARLDGHIYFHGNEKPSRIDLVICGFLMNSLSTKSNPHWAKLVLKSPAIVSFAQRLTQSLFPEYTGLLLELEAAQRGFKAAFI